MSASSNPSSHRHGLRCAAMFCVRSRLQPMVIVIASHHSQGRKASQLAGRRYAHGRLDAWQRDSCWAA